jgi:hypothetical protein
VFVLACNTDRRLYITLAYGRTAEHGVQPQLSGNAATSPLNVILLAASSFPRTPGARGASCS